MSSSRERRLAHDSRGRKATARRIHDDGRVLKKEGGKEDGMYVKGPEGAREGRKAREGGRVCGVCGLGQSKYTKKRNNHAFHSLKRFE